MVGNDRIDQCRGSSTIIDTCSTRCTVSADGSMTHGHRAVIGNTSTLCACGIGGNGIVHESQWPV